jgi:hypothetical protein
LNSLICFLSATNITALGSYQNYSAAEQPLSGGGSCARQHTQGYAKQSQPTAVQITTYFCRIHPSNHPYQEAPTSPPNNNTNTPLPYSNLDTTLRTNRDNLTITQPHVFLDVHLILTSNIKYFLSTRPMLHINGARAGYYELFCKRLIAQITCIVNCSISFIENGIIS